MSNNKFQKFVKGLLKIEDEPQKKYTARPMNDENAKSGIVQKKSQNESK